MTDKFEEIILPLPTEFIELCEEINTPPEDILKGFIADLCEIQSCGSNPRTDGYNSNGSDERMMAQQYFDRCGYRIMAEIRNGEKTP